jgi:hypothetical protein
VHRFPSFFAAIIAARIQLLGIRPENGRGQTSILRGNSGDRRWCDSRRHARQAATLRTRGVSQPNTQTINRQATYEHERKAAGQTSTPDLGTAQARHACGFLSAGFSAQVVNAGRGARLRCRVLDDRDGHGEEHGVSRGVTRRRQLLSAKPRGQVRPCPCPRVLACGSPQAPLLGQLVERGPGCLGVHRRRRA